MRPIATEQSYVRYPLNELLGTEANVRLLRALCDEVEGPLSVADAAQRAGLTEAGARRALSRVARTGFVVRIGKGRAFYFAMREGDGLLAALTELFGIERKRFDSLLEALRATFQPLSEVRIAWISELPNQPGQPLHLYLCTDASSVPHLSTAVRPRINEVEKQFDLTIEVHVSTSADVDPVDWKNAILVAGFPPHEMSEASSLPATHVDRDRRALWLSEAIASLLDRDPSLAPRARRHLERMLADEQGSAAHDLREWLDVLLSYSPERLKQFLIADTPRANRLRQSSPFFAVLTPDERDQVLASLERKR